MRGRFHAWVATVAAATAVAAPAAAQDGTPRPSLDLRGFHPPTDPRGSLFLEPSSTPGEGNWNVGVWASYARDSVVLTGPPGSDLPKAVENQVSMDYVAALGILEELAIGLRLPTIVYQNGGDRDELATLDATDRLPRAAIGDLGFGAKASLVPPAALGGFGLAALGEVSAPTGDRSSYLGEGVVTGGLRLLAEMTWPGLAIRATAGAKLRGKKRVFVGQEFGHEAPWGLGIALKPQALGFDDSGRWEITLESHGALAITPSFASAAQSPAAIGLSTRYTVGDASVLVGIEAPVNDAVGNPLIRPVASIGWAPRFVDEDGDGLGDDTDECPELPEDRDGFQDTDGCPDFDDDDDGVPDMDDQCREEAEDEDEFLDDDGCPDPDNDGDGLADVTDACPNQSGAPTSDPKTSGCPALDRDGDKILDDRDRCIDQPEDLDGFEDEDGCPERDNDRDGIADAADACPDQKGRRSSDPELNGCPNPDRDGDTFDDQDDKCPEKPEDFDGDADDDGCPDDDSAKPAWQQAKPLVTVNEVQGDWVLSWRLPPKFVGDELDPKTMPTVRALAQKLNEKPDWIVAVGVRPIGVTPEATQSALSRSFVLVNELRALTHRDSAAETVGWAAVSKQKGAFAAGIGVLVFAPPAPSAAPTKKK